jgi:hypothetical protein
VPPRWHKTAWLKARETSAGVMAIIALLTLHRRYLTTSMLCRERGLCCFGDLVVSFVAREGKVSMLSCDQGCLHCCLETLFEEEKKWGHLDFT